ncbi:RHS repeat-associated core domain-containing protein [Streptomyces sp. NPDC005728]|uniref:RHS repeat-associated core domain-containing protein n=1 Tax=Streptomyces sp. NPDC005728 TaxID=3157054 RepID=UPI0033EF7453
MSFVTSPSAAAADADTTPLVPSQSLGTVPAQQQEEVGKPLPKPVWPAAAEATVDLSQAAPGDPGTVTPSPSASASGSSGGTQVGDVVEVAPLAEPKPDTAPQLARVRAAGESPSAEPSPSSTPEPEATPSSAGEPTLAASPSETASADPSPTASPSADPEPSPVSPEQVDVRLLDRQEVAPVSGVGLGLQVTRSDGVSAPGQVQVSIDYSGFKYAYGADFASRLVLVKMPACALQTPGAEECASRDVVPAENDTAQGTLTATVEAAPDTQGLSTQLVSGGASVYALSSGSSSDQGDFRASTLSASGSWEVATGSGAFTYNLPVQLPSPAMGTAPGLALSYNSQSVDGRTSATNNQASWAGMGWDLGAGFIERRYRNCTQDGLKTIGDMCWDSPNTAKEPDGAVYVISLNGVTSTLVQDNNGTGSYHLEDDPGWRVQHLWGGHGADDEYWVISTQDGQRYYFGWGRSERTQAATASVFTMPVVGNNAGEPCHDQFPEPCTQAWRWNLDRVVDANEVESAYFYDKEYNYYRSVANGDKARQYTSAGYLNEIQYGWASQVPGSLPTGKVVLTHVGRCVERMSDTDPLRSEPGACPSISSSPSSYPDVPVDLMCDGTSGDYYCAGKTYYPTFFSKDMLWDIKTYVLSTSADDWDLVQQYQTKHALPNPDGSIGKTLWLDYVQRKTYGSGTDLVLPVINFNGVDLDNKVGSTELNFRRVSTIHGDLGATTTVTYGQPNPCSADNLPTESSNTQDCFWQKWTPEGATDSKAGWFKKFLVTKVTTDPTVTTSQDGAPEMTTSYDYQGGAGWGFTNDPLTPDEDESWSDWRGYQRVEVTGGSGSGKHSTFSWLYRGLDGDRTSKTDPTKTRTVTVTDGDNTSYPDSAWLRGKTIETSTRDDAAGSHERVFHSYWTHDTAQYEGLPDARFVRESQTRTMDKTSTGWREHIVQNEYDATVGTSATYGLPLRVDDWGQTGVSDNSCTTYGRAYNTDMDGSIQRWTVLIDETLHYAAGCDDRASTNQDGYTVTLYDNATTVDGNKPYDGNATEIRTHTQSDKYRAAYYGYDNAGRVIWHEDGKHQRTNISFNPAANWPTDGITTTSPLAGLAPRLSSTIWKSRYWGLVYKSQDANGNVTWSTLDAAGRVTEVWKPTETGDSPSVTYSYSVPTSTLGGVPDSVDGFPRVGTHVLQSGTTYLHSYAYTDALGRTRETQIPLPSDERQVSATRYDDAGNVTGTSAVFRSQGTAGSGGPVSPKVEDLPSYTDLTLDWAGRTTQSKILIGDGSGFTTSQYGGTRTEYHDDYTTALPSNSGATDTYTDVFGRTSKVVEHNGTSTFTTAYGYNAKGQLAKITDSRGNTTKYGYDWAGQRTSVDDPDSGLSRTEYDANGQISKTTSNILDLGHEIQLTYSYDNLGRKTAVSDGSTELASWTWDGSIGLNQVPGGLGQIVASTSRDADGNLYTTKVNSFDGRGRPQSTTTTIPAAVSALAGSYTTGLHYDAADHVTSIDYPAAGGLPAETVTTGYTAYGHPRSLQSGLQTYIQSTGYDSYGRLTGRTYGQPPVNPDTVNTERSYTYDDANGTRWLKSITTSASMVGFGSSSGFTTEVQKDTYTYNADGQITSIRESAANQPTQNQCFVFDDQARLTKAWTRDGSCLLPSGISDFTGPDPYESSYSYDRLGNLQSVTSRGSDGKATTRDYLYPGYDDSGTWTTANAAHPHGVRKINHLQDGTTTATESFSYNFDGQMTQHVEPTKTSDYTWTKLGRLATAKTTDSSGSKLTRYTYDANGTLLVRATPQETVAYLGGMELRTTDGTSATATRYYTSGSSTVAMRTTTDNTTAGGTVTYLMADTQASTQLAVDATTGTATRRRYTPFGDQRSGTLPTGTDHGFLGKTEDTSTGLSLLGARAYDPHLGRFLSPDPLSTPYDPQNLSAYSYSGNDPINYSDPTGLITYDKVAYPETSGQCTGGWNACNGSNPGRTKTGGTVAGSGGGSGSGSSGSSGSSGGSGGLGGWLGDLARSVGDEIISIGTAAKQQFDTETQCIGLHADDCVNVVANLIGTITGQSVGKGLVSRGAEIYGDYANGRSAQGTGKVVFDLVMLVATRRGFVAGEAADGMKLRSLLERGCSFTPSTPVLMAHGKTKPIGKLKTGDKVEAADPADGKHKGLRKVTATHINHDYDLVDLRIKRPDGGVTTLHTTAKHPFWDDTLHAWVPAGELRTGHNLNTASDHHVRVAAVIARSGDRDMYNLTVDDLHTYYVLAGETPVLVHNSGGCPDLDALSQSGMRPAKGKTTHAGREYQKHMNRGDLPVVPGKELKTAGQDLLDDILTNPQTATSAVNSGNFAGGTRYIMPDPAGGRGIGATFDANGQFQYFGRY